VAMSATTLLPPRAWPAPDASEQVGEQPTPPPAAAEAETPTTRPTPTWFVPSYVALLVTTAVAYVWGLGASGWANAYYSAAAQAASSSWKAWFFGSFDSANAITVDKPPASLWVMGISARIFGVNSWSILVPEALMGVATVALLVLVVKRWFHPGAALLAGIVAATTPVAVLMFRFNNPDALLVLLLTAAAYTLTRAVDSPRWRWVLATGALVGFAFLAKMLQAFIVLPAFGVTYLLAASTTFRTRVLHLLGLGAATIAAAGWWVLTVELWPASSRPYIGGSQTNSVLELIVGYNGLGRLTGNETGSVGGGGGGNGAGRWGETGLLRMFNSSYGGQASWLLPAALAIFAIGMVATWRRRRADRTRAALLLWGLTLVATAVTFSLGQGIIHEYYTVALVPPIAALVGIGASMAWEHRSQLAARVATAAVVVLSAWWSYVLLDRTPGWTPWLRMVVVVAGVVGVIGVLAAGRRRWMALAAAGVVTAGLLAGPVAYSLNTIDTAHTGSLPTAGPSTGRGPGGMGGPGGAGGFPGGAGGPGGGAMGTPPSMGNGQPPAFAGGQAPSFGGSQAGTGQAPAFAGGQQGPGGTGGAGGLLNASEPSAELVSALEQDAGRYTWVAATIGANSAAGYQLATGDPVLAVGGFNGTDDYPSLAEFQQLVAEGDIHWFIAGGGFGGGMGGSQSSSEISSWVQSSFTSTTVGGVTLYDLTSPSST